MKTAAAIALCVVSLLVAQAQRRPPRPPTPPRAGDSTIVHIPGLGCTTGAGADRFTTTSFRVGEYFVSSTGKTALQDFTIYKQIDECTPKLLQAIATGAHFQAAGIMRNDLNYGPRLRFTIQDVTVSSFQPSGSQTMPAGTEAVTLHFSWFGVRVQLDGTNYTEYCYDAKTARQVGCTFVAP